MSVIKNPKTEGFEDILQINDIPDDEDDSEIGSRYVEIGGKEYKFVFRDPYGHCFIVAKKGRLPDALTGAYTSVQEAERAILQWTSREQEKIKKAKA